MNDRDRTDLWTALAIGAVVGVGAALLLRSGEPETQTKRLLKSLKPMQRDAGRAMKSARKELGRSARRWGSVGEGLLEESADALSSLRKDAAKIVAQAREELEDVARSSMKEARRGARRAKRRLA